MTVRLIVIVLLGGASWRCESDDPVDIRSQATIEPPGDNSLQAWEDHLDEEAKRVRRYASLWRKRNQGTLTPAEWTELQELEWSLMLPSGDFWTPAELDRIRRTTRQADQI